MVALSGMEAAAARGGGTWCGLGVSFRRQGGAGVAAVAWRVLQLLLLLQHIFRDILVDSKNLVLVGSPLQVSPDDKRYQLRCSAGCLVVCHVDCWRDFEKGYEAETRDSSSSGHGVNLIQVCVCCVCAVCVCAV